MAQCQFEFIRKYPRVHKKYRVVEDVDEEIRAIKMQPLTIYIISESKFNPN